MARTLLIIDDEPNMRWVLGRALEQAGYTVRAAATGDEAAGVLGREAVDLVLLDLKLKGEDGLVILRRLRERWPALVVIIITAYGTVATAVEAMQLGAADFLRKPFDVEEITFKVARTLERRAMQQEIARLTVLQRSAPAFDSLIGAAVRWEQLLAKARQAALSDQHVLISGEPGSGRSTLARAIHVAQGDVRGPLVEFDLNLYAPAAQAVALFGQDDLGGAWYAAGNGSLLLTGLAEAPGIQETLIEWIAGTSPNTGPRLFIVTADAEQLAEALAAQFPIRLAVPPLRERPGDVLLLAHHFAVGRPITPAAAQRLEQYGWPQNVAELRSVLIRATQLAGDSDIDSSHLPDYLGAHRGQARHDGIQLPSEGINLEDVEQDFIRQALERAHGNKSKAAELLGLTRHTLLYRMEKYGITAPDRN